MKMYILIRDDISEGFSVLAAAHASLACYLKYKNDLEMQSWISDTFYKVVCKVNDKEFQKAKEFEDHIVLTESALDHKEVAIAFKPREEWPKPFKFYRLYK